MVPRENWKSGVVWLDMWVLESDVVIWPIEIRGVKRRACWMCRMRDMASVLTAPPVETMVWAQEGTRAAVFLVRVSMGYGSLGDFLRFDFLRLVSEYVLRCKKRRVWRESSDVLFALVYQAHMWLFL